MSCSTCETTTVCNKVALVEEVYEPNIEFTLIYLPLETEDPPTALDITGATFRMMVRNQTFNNAVILEASTANGKITIVPLTIDFNGTPVSGDGIQVDLSSADTLQIYQETTASFSTSDIKMTLPSDRPRPIVKLTLTPCVFDTRDYPVSC